MASIAQAQAKFLESGGLDKGGMLRPDPSELSELEKELSRYIVQFLDTASDNLNKTGSITTGALDESLSLMCHVRRLQQGWIAVVITGCQKWVVPNI